MNRRKFIKRSFLGAMGLGLFSSLYAWQLEPFWLEFVKLKMAIPNLPNHLQGKTLMQISDVHVGNRFDYQYIIDAFKEAQNFKPDFVVYTGDYVNYENEQQITQLNQVFKHAVRGNYGTAAILGNHDYGKNWAESNVAENITRALKKAGLDVLRNEQISYNGLNVIGLDDFWGTNFYPQPVLDSYDKETANIVLCHNPDVCDLNIWNNYNSWILSGHTHGGQCKPPFLKAPMLPVKNKKYDQGEIDLEDGRKLYINRALGHLWQIRFNVRPEITIFELQKA